MSAAFCEHHEKLELFRNGGDPYITMATKIFGYMCNKKDHPTERGVGKATELGCGYGMGRDRFRNYLNAGPLGMQPTFLEDIPALAHEVNPYLTVVNAYREQNWPIPEMWRRLESVLMDMTYKGTNTTLGPLKITFERMTGPNGLSLQYPQLGYRNKQWSYLSADGWTNLFGGKVLENIIQFLSRIGICEQMVLIAAMAEYLGGRCVLQVHDEIVTLIWDEITDKFDDFANEVMHANLPWMPSCPLASEADIGPTYS
jgi:DNA polymerase